MRTLLVFAKAPILGRVKTRLAASIGNDNALQIYIAFLQDLAKVINKLDRVNIKWWIDGDPNRLKEIIGDADFHIQRGADLGERLCTAVNDAFKESHGPVAVIGSDCPLMKENHLEKLFISVEKGNKAAIIPTADGGYAAIAMAEPFPKVFENIPWSTNQVLGSTVKAFKKLGIKINLLVKTYDVDTIDDLISLTRDLAADEKSAPRTFSKASEILASLDKTARG